MMDQNSAFPRDEMVDRTGRLRTPWVPVMEAVRAIGPEELSRRAASLNRQVRLAAPFGAIARHHYDPLPAPLTASEFAGLETGLRQRATCLTALLEDCYGRQLWCSANRNSCAACILRRRCPTRGYRCMPPT
jgi:uncharacterized circularly permuted ATP-grasp superfamily protein